MTKFEFLGINIVFVKEGIMFGVISTCVLSHFRIYSQLQNYLVMGYPITKAVLLVADHNKLSEEMVFKIKREMEIEL